MASGRALWWTLRVGAARQVGAERTYLTHLTHDRTHVDLEADLPSGVMPAFDGLTAAALRLKSRIGSSATRFRGSDRLSRCSGAATLRLEAQSRRSGRWIPLRLARNVDFKRNPVRTSLLAFG
jgi:hypothetical protein